MKLPFDEYKTWLIFIPKNSYCKFKFKIQISCQLHKIINLFFSVFQFSSPLNILPYQYPPQPLSTGSIDFSPSTIGSAGLSPTQSISSHSSHSQTSASPDVISTPLSTPVSPSSPTITANNCNNSNLPATINTNNSNNNNYGFGVHHHQTYPHHMEIASR